MTTQNKVALVTGGSRGLGKDMALRLAEQGNNVLITYHTNATEAAAVVATIEAMGRKAAAFQLNTADTKTYADFYTAVAQWLETHTGKAQFHCLVNNAGTALHAPFADTTEDQFDAIMNIHYKAVFFMAQKALPYLADGGRIVNISSGLARFSYPGSSAYGSAKGAVEVLTRYMARELGSRGITVNVVAPGAIETDFGGGLVRDNPQLNAQIASVTALGRVGLPTDIGGVVAFLCSDAAKWITGQRIEVSGGMNL
jgi:NAD(P)-dependent dehydrogenase (short-subunit alcohol dehydrogenase family)